MPQDINVQEVEIALVTADLHSTSVNPAVLNYRDSLPPIENLLTHMYTRTI